jgi:hypothetical protein
MNVNPNVVSSALPLSLAAEPETAFKPTMAESPRGEVPIIITSHAPDREQSYPSLGGGAEPALPMPLEVYFHPTTAATPARMPATTALPIITTTAPLPAAFVVNNTGGVYYPPAPATIITTTTAPADLLPQPATHYDASTMGLPYQQQPLQQQVVHNVGYQPAAESTAREGPLTDSMSKFVARDIAEACLTMRPPIEEETSNEKCAAHPFFLSFVLLRSFSFVSFSFLFRSFVSFFIHFLPELLARDTPRATPNDVPPNKTRGSLVFLYSQPRTPALSVVPQGRT